MLLLFQELNCKSNEPPGSSVTLNSQINVGNLYISQKERYLLIVHVDVQNCKKKPFPRNHAQSLALSWVVDLDVLGHRSWGAGSWVSGPRILGLGILGLESGGLGVLGPGSQVLFLTMPVGCAFDSCNVFKVGIIIINLFYVDKT